MFMSLVVTHFQMGVFLGSCGGMDIWSKIDSFGMDAAFVFDSIEDAEDHFHALGGLPQAAALVEVTADLQEGRFASMGACTQAGIESWVNEEILEEQCEDI
jgi:hypothetical protein